MTKIGILNARVKSTAWIGNKKFEFDGTVKGLVRSAVSIGATDGTKIKANFGGRLKSEARDIMIISAPHDNRAMGFWAE